MNEIEYAGFWSRTGAALIDIIFWVIFITIPLSFIYGEGYWTGEQSYYGSWDVIMGYVFPFVVTVWFWMKFFGTPGKIVLKLKVVDAKTGNKLTMGRAVGRYFAYIPAILPLFLGIIWVGIDKKKQGWHDKIAGTLVIKTKRSEPVTAEKQE